MLNQNSTRSFHPNTEAAEAVRRAARQEQYWREDRLVLQQLTHTLDSLPAHTPSATRERIVELCNEYQRECVRYGQEVARLLAQAAHLVERTEIDPAYAAPGSLWVRLDTRLPGPATIDYAVESLDHAWVLAGALQRAGVVYEAVENDEATRVARVDPDGWSAL